MAGIHSFPFQTSIRSSHSNLCLYGSFLHILQFSLNAFQKPGRNLETSFFIFINIYYFLKQFSISLQVTNLKAQQMKSNTQFSLIFCLRIIQTHKKQK